MSIQTHIISLILTHIGFRFGWMSKSNSSCNKYDFLDNLSFSIYKIVNPTMRKHISIGRQEKCKRPILSYLVTSNIDKIYLLPYKIDYYYSIISCSFELSFLKTKCWILIFIIIVLMNAKAKIYEKIKNSLSSWYCYLIEFYKESFFIVLHTIHHIVQFRFDH